MKIMFYGDGPWAHLALEYILKSKDLTVNGVVLRYDTQDPVLRRMAESYNIKAYSVPDVNSVEFVELNRNFDIDLSVSMSFNQIIRKPLRDASKHGFINCHAGKLPNYRGRNILNWVIINDEKEFGITAHFIDDGIDTGDIVSQAVIPIEEYDNYKTLLDKAVQKCPEVLLDAIYKIRDNRISVITQRHIKGSYFSQRRTGDELIDWNWTSRRIHNFIRALVEPAPGAQTYLEGKKIYIWESEEINYPDYVSTPGEVIDKDKNGIIVKTGDNALKIRLVTDESSKDKYIPRIPIGKRFGINLFSRVLELEERLKHLEEKLK